MCIYLKTENSRTYGNADGNNSEKKKKLIPDKEDQTTAAFLREDEEVWHLEHP